MKEEEEEHPNISYYIVLEIKRSISLMRMKETSIRFCLEETSYTKKAIKKKKKRCLRFFCTNLTACKYVKTCLNVFMRQAKKYML